MKKILLSLSVVTLCICQALSQTDPYADKLKKMMSLAGTEANFQVAIKQMIQMFKGQKTNVPQEVWTEFEKEFSKNSLETLVELLIPVYKKHMTEDDLDKMIEFYQTPTGKKFAEKTPLIMQESMQVGQAWGAKIGEQFAARMREAGY